jgi:cytochrome c oxidase subunit 2
MHLHRLERIWLTFGVAILAIFLATVTTAALVDGFVPPSHVQSIDPAKVSVTPPFDKPGLHKLANGSYEAYYVAHIFAFAPHRLVVPLGAHVTFYVTSTDVVHGFSIPETGVNTMVTPGWVSTVSHTFHTRGTYLLVCNEYCGIEHQTMADTIEVR